VGTTAGPRPQATAPISVGFIVPVGQAAIAPALGLQGAEPQGDPQVIWQALVNDQNARGGLLGHPIRPVYYTRDPNGASQAAQEEAACAKLTQDNHVVVAFIYIIHTTLLLDCLERAGVATFIIPGHSEEDATTYRQHPHLRGVGHLNLTRLAATLVDGLWRQGFFTRGARIGLVYWDDPAYARAVPVLKRQLASHGLSITAEAATSPARELRDSGPTGAENGNAALRFRQERVDHVLFIGGGGSPSIFFTKAAESQEYYPKYGISTNDLPALLIQNVSARTAANVWGVGHAPYQDMHAQPTGAAATRCSTVLKRAGQPLGGDPSGWDYCAGFDLLVTGATAGGAPVTARSILSGLSRAGVLTNTVQYPRLDYTRNGDGIVQARSFRYKATCKCIQYTSAPYPAAN
jgi:hypothetical protein